MDNEAALAVEVERLLGGNPDSMADPFPVWNRLRNEHPVLRIGSTVVLSQHADVKTAVSDNGELYSRASNRYSGRFSDAREQFSPDGRQAFERVLDHEYGQIVRMDPPDHPRVRRVVVPPFSARALAREMDGQVREHIRVSLDELEAADEGGSVDFRRFAYTMPLRVLGDLLGIPLDELDSIHMWSQALAENKLNAESEMQAIEADEAYEALMNYIDTLVTRQQASGHVTGLVAALLEAERTGRISRFEVREMLALMIFAGHETTSNLLSIGMLELLRRPEQWAKLCASPALIPSAVEELLRFVTPSQFVQYVVKRSHEVEGVALNEGETAISILAAANRDPAVFTDPDELNIERQDSRFHVALGLGPHFCIGAGLARMEATFALREITRRFPNAQLTSGDIRWAGRVFRGPTTLRLAMHG